MKALIVCILALGSGVGCGTEMTAPDERAPADTAPPRTELRVWAHDIELVEAAQGAATRLETVSGLQAVVNEDMNDLPMFLSDSGVGDWWGCSRIVGELGTEGNWIAVGVDVAAERLETVVLHEFLHQFGAPHVEPGTGLLGEPEETDFVTAADLEALCAVAACGWMVPEN